MNSQNYVENLELVDLTWASVLSRDNHKVEKTIFVGLLFGEEERDKVSKQELKEWPCC